MIDHDKKFVFLQIPKTGSDSICNCLLKFLCKKNMMSELSNKSIFGGCGHHSNLEELVNQTNQTFEDYFIFTIVRNPFDRVLSEYTYIPKYLAKIESGEIRRICNNLNGYSVESFRDKFPTFTSYVKNIPEIIFLNGHGRPQYSYVRYKKPDFIGRFENLQEDFDTICDKIGIPKQQLPHLNKTKHKHYTEYYDDETREIVAKKYAKDIEYFGYEFRE